MGEIITFYSYKGGVGRSMILANVAWILASNGKRVLVVDWDLEAPGLHRYFHPFLLDKSLNYTEGVIDFLLNFIDKALTPSEEDDENWYKPFASLAHYTVSLEWDFPKEGFIDFVPAGKQNADYAERVNSFNWQNFYERFGGGVFLNYVRKEMRNEYDYILIDSRTGISDTSGICTVQMPDILAVFFTANDQSILGAAGVANSVNDCWQTDVTRLKDKCRIFPVLTRIEYSEEEKLKVTKEYAKSKFFNLLQLSQKKQNEYWGNVEIPYVPFYAYEEILATFNDDPYRRNSLLAAIEQLVAYLTNGEVKKLNVQNYNIKSNIKREEILAKFTRNELNSSSKTNLEAKRTDKPDIDLSEWKDKLIFIDAAMEDFELATEFIQILRKHDIKYFSPNDTSNNSSTIMYEDFIHNLLLCNTVLLIYDKAPLSWLVEHLRITYQRSVIRRIEHKHILVCSSQPKPLNFRLTSNTYWIEYLHPPKNCLSTIIKILKND